MQGKENAPWLIISALGPAVLSLSWHKQWLLWNDLTTSSANVCPPPKKLKTKNTWYILELSYQGNKSGLKRALLDLNEKVFSSISAALTAGRIGEQMAGKKGRKISHILFFFFLITALCKNFPGLLNIWIIYSNHPKCSIYSHTAI